MNQSTATSNSKCAKCLFPIDFGILIHSKYDSSIDLTYAIQQPTNTVLLSSFSPMQSTFFILQAIVCQQCFKSEVISVIGGKIVSAPLGWQRMVGFYILHKESLLVTNVQHSMMEAIAFYCKKCHMLLGFNASEMGSQAKIDTSKISFLFDRNAVIIDRNTQVLEKASTVYYDVYCMTCAKNKQIVCVGRFILSTISEVIFTVNQITFDYSVNIFDYVLISFYERAPPKLQVSEFKMVKSITEYAENPISERINALKAKILANRKKLLSNLEYLAPNLESSLKCLEALESQIELNAAGTEKLAVMFILALGRQL